MKKDYFYGLKGAVVTRGTETRTCKVTNEQVPITTAGAAFNNALPMLPVLPAENTFACASMIENVQTFVNQVHSATTLDDLWAVIRKVRQAELSPQERNCFWRSCLPQLERFFSVIPNDDLVGNMPATLGERIVIEWFRLGWFRHCRQDRGTQ